MHPLFHVGPKMKFQPWGFTSHGELCVDGFGALAAKCFHSDSSVFYFDFRGEREECAFWSPQGLTMLWSGLPLGLIGPVLSSRLFRHQVPFFNQE